MAILRAYLEMSALLALGYGLLRAIAAARPQEPLRWLRLGQAVFVLAIVLPIFSAAIPREYLPPASVQVWSGHARGTGEAYTLWTPASGLASQVSGFRIGDARLSNLFWFAIAALVLALLYHAFRLRTLVRVLRAATRIRKIGRVSVLISDTELIPFSAWLPGSAYVVIPIGLLSQGRDFGIAVRHEIQHHRQGDTRWVHFFYFFKALFFWNPVAHAWARLMERLQELACDEVLMGRQNLSPQAYASCLYRAAQLVLNGSSAPLAGTAGMAASRSGRFLKRRIEMLFVSDRKRSSKFFTSCLVLGALTLMASSAFAARGFVQDRALSLGQARKLVEGDGGGAIPITVNARVLRRLDRYVGTPEGRDYVKHCLARMPHYEAMITGKIAAQGFPPELLAMPMQESCFRNDVISPAPFRARGIWQFIEPTALNYGLAIDNHVDERLDPEKETDAAMRYLKDLMGLFGDWRLAIKGYNEGEKRVQSLIDQYHTRDPWELEDLSTSEDYLAGTMAMMIILKHPALLN